MDKSIKNLIVCLLVIFLITPGIKNNLQAQPPAAEKVESVEKLIKDFNKKDTPGGAVLVMRDGKVIYSRAFGMANLTHNIPFEIHTLNNIGSTSKQFTAFAIALLEQRGLLSVNDDVRKHIPELPDLGDTVRLKHLISHTSGYREYFNTLLMAGRQFTDLIRDEEIFLILENQPSLQNKPGESYNYNNTGYFLLARVVEKVTGEDFPIWMKENVFLPLGMENTVVRKNPGQVIPGNAQGYFKREDDVFYETLDLWASMGAGGMYSTVTDLAKWTGNFFKPAPGKSDLMQKMQTPFLLNNGDTMSYAWGLLVGELNGLKMVEHGGADIAHRSMLMMFPEVKGAVITQSNNAQFPPSIAYKIAEIFFADVMDIEKDEKPKPDEEKEFEFDLEKFDEFAGRYELEASPGFILEFRRDGEKLLTQATGQPEIEIFASSDTTFYLKVVEASVTFHRNEEGVVDHITLHQMGDHRANRIFEPAWKPSEEDIRQFVGRYFSFELEAFYSIQLNDEGELELHHRRHNPLVLKAEAEDEFSAGFPLPNIKFIRDQEGEITGFKASSGRATGILFEKQ
ncbi:MAG: serine hydrolase [Bacteroidetes bacterium]|nr:MAG: serine hydrolase [Bacteroidota bacterium]